MIFNCADRGVRTRLWGTSTDVPPLVGEESHPARVGLSARRVASSPLTSVPRLSAWQHRPPLTCVLRLGRASTTGVVSLPPPFPRANGARTGSRPSPSSSRRCCPSWCPPGAQAADLAAPTWCNRAGTRSTAGVHEHADVQHRQHGGQPDRRLRGVEQQRRRVDVPTPAGTRIPVAGARRPGRQRWGAQVFYARNIAGGANTVTAPFSSVISGCAIVYVHEYSGVDKLDPVDGHSGRYRVDAQHDSGTVTTTATNDLLLNGGASKADMTAGGAGVHDAPRGSATAAGPHPPRPWPVHADHDAEPHERDVMTRRARARHGRRDATPPEVSITSPGSGAQWATSST